MPSTRMTQKDSQTYMILLQKSTSADSKISHISQQDRKNLSLAQTSDTRQIHLVIKH
jgi:hypothetical protein